MERLVSHNKVAGIKQTTSAINSGEAQVVYVACDADPCAVAGLSELCCERGIDIVSDYTRKELAKACRIDVPCAAAAVLK